MHLKLSGIKVPHRKNTASMQAVTMAPSSKVTIPMNMSIGMPSTPIVKVGDTVKVGQLIAECSGHISSNIHSSVSGTVRAIAPMWTSNGGQTTAITIESDGFMSVSEDCVPPKITDYESFISAIRASGLVGLGGAGFPTAVKLDIKDLSRLEEVVINGAECEPYITSDTLTMTNKPELVREGIELLIRYLGVKKVIIGVEENKPDAVRKMQELHNDIVSVKVLPSIYPQGAEKVLIYNCTGKVVPEKKLPIDVGVLVINVSTIAFIAEYVKTGMPLTQRTITVDGGGVLKPQLVNVLVGTPMSEVFDFCGGLKENVGKIFYGGPMTGVTVKDISSPILKNTNAIIALDEKDSHLPEPTTCIRCGRCVRACPLSLMPLDFARAYALHDYDLLEKRKVNICMECGCCSYVCPANRPLVENNKLAKAALRKHKEKLKGETK